MRPGALTSRSKILLLAFAFVAVLAVVFWSGRSPSKTNSTKVNSSLGKQTNSLAQPSAMHAGDRLRSHIDELLRTEDPAQVRSGLLALQQKLSSLRPDLASSIVRSFLDSGADVPTQLGFKIGPEGQLKEAPSLRVFLLDYFIQVDPLAAAAYAERILSSSSSADEWAISLKAYALGHPKAEADSFLKTKVREMLANEVWANDASAGFLEAFDVIVYTRATEFSSSLADLLRQKESRALAHAAYLTLDRLIQGNPIEVLGQLQARPELLEGREYTRADYFARADLGDAQQRQLLENYLLASDRSEAELRKFANIYPNANYLISNNLLTPTTPVSGAALSERRRNALKVVREWSGDPKFAKIKAHVQVIKANLESIVEARP